MCFLPRDKQARDYVIQHFEQVVAKEGQTMVGWRDVPTDLTGLGKTVIETMPVIRQAIVASNLSIRDQDAFERKILAIRKQILNNLRQPGGEAEHSGCHRTLYAVLLDPDGGLQGSAAGDAGRQFLPRPAQSADHVGAGAGASAFLDQHVPVLEAGAPVPVPGP